MNNEPVAWMARNELLFSVVKDEIHYIPLYTHPTEHDLGIAEAIGFDKGYKAATAKTLTDAEIRTIQDMCHLKNVGYNNFIMRFARAILRKAQEK